MGLQLIHRTGFGSRFGVETDPNDGVPDGITIDTQDRVWVSFWWGDQVK